MRIAVTGGTGQVGGLVVRLLAGEGRHDVVAPSSRTAPYDDPAALRAGFAIGHRPKWALSASPAVPTTASSRLERFAPAGWIITDWAACHG